MIGKLDRYLELSYDYAHGDGLSDEQLVEYESLQKEINHSIKIKELVKKTISNLGYESYVKHILQSLVEESEK